MDLQRQRKSRERTARNTLIQALKKGLVLFPTCQPCSEILFILVALTRTAWWSSVWGAPWGLPCSWVSTSSWTLLVGRSGAVGDGHETPKHSLIPISIHLLHPDLPILHPDLPAVLPRGQSLSKDFGVGHWPWRSCFPRKMKRHVGSIHMSGRTMKYCRRLRFISSDRLASFAGPIKALNDAIHHGLDSSSSDWGPGNFASLGPSANSLSNPRFHYRGSRRRAKLWIFFLKSAAGHLQVKMELMVDDSLKLIIAIIRNIQEENHRKMIHGRIFSIVMF